MKDQRPSDQELRNYAADTARDLFAAVIEYIDGYSAAAVLWNMEPGDERAK